VVSYQGDITLMADTSLNFGLSVSFYERTDDGTGMLLKC